MIEFFEGIKWKVWLGVIAALLACLPLTYCKGRSDGRSAERAAQAKSQLKEEQKARVDDGKAAQRRAENKIQTDKQEQARKEAIDNAPDDKTDAPGRALACERLRQAGIDAPASCG